MEHCRSQSGTKVALPKRKRIVPQAIIKHEVLWYIHQMELNVPTHSDVTFKGDDDMLSHENGYLF